MLNVKNHKEQAGIPKRQRYTQDSIFGYWQRFQKMDYAYQKLEHGYESICYYFWR